MRYQVRHCTEYQYSQPVYVEPHLIRLQPRSDATQRLLDYQCVIQPNPASRSGGLDAEGNSFTLAVFEGLISSLIIETSFIVETLRANPFDFLMAPEAQSLPVRYPERSLPHLAPYIEPSPSRCSSLERFKGEVMEESGGETLDFLWALTQRIKRDFNYEVREEGAPQPVETTLELAKGSCRDLTVLYIEVCRACGIAARFVSGYEEGSPEQEVKQLHAWAEVYLPGGGWRGYDPTLGLAVADRHIPVAASSASSEAAPVIGSFRGTGASSSMTSHIELNECDN